MAFRVSVMKSDIVDIIIYRSYEAWSTRSGSDDVNENGEDEDDKN